MLSLLVTVLIVASVGAQHCCTPRAWEGEYYSGLGYIKTGEVEANFAKVNVSMHVNVCTPTFSCCFSYN